MRKIVDEIVSEQLDAVKLTRHLVKALDQGAHLGLGVMVDLDLRLKISLFDLLGRANERLKRAQIVPAEKARQCHTDCGTHTEQGCREKDGI